MDSRGVQIRSSLDSKGLQEISNSLDSKEAQGVSNSLNSKGAQQISLDKVTAKEVQELIMMSLMIKVYMASNLVHSILHNLVLEITREIGRLDRKISLVSRESKDNKDKVVNVEDRGISLDNRDKETTVKGEDKEINLVRNKFKLPQTLMVPQDRDNRENQLVPERTSSIKEIVRNNKAN